MANGPIVGRIEIDLSDDAKRALDAFGKSSAALIESLQYDREHEHEHDVVEGEISADITPDLGAWGDLDMTHTVVSATPPEMCACGQPVHAGTQWVNNGGDFDTLSVALQMPEMPNPHPLSSANEGDAWLIMLGTRRDTDKFVGVVSNGGRLLLRDSALHGDPRASSDQSGKIGIALDDPRIIDARLLYRQGEPTTELRGRVASAVFTDDFVSELRAEFVRDHETGAREQQESFARDIQSAIDELTEARAQIETLHRQIGEQSEARQALDRIVYRARTTLRDDDVARRNGGDAPSKRQTLDHVTAILSEASSVILGKTSMNTRGEDFRHTVDALDALLEHAVVIDRSDDVWQKRGGMWHSYETTSMNAPLLAKYAPFTVLHEGRFA